MKMNDAELGTVLAALRYYQEQGMCDPMNRPDRIHWLATGGGNIMASLDDEGIDDLCIRLNVEDDYDSL